MGWDPNDITIRIPDNFVSCIQKPFKYWMGFQMGISIADKNCSVFNGGLNSRSFNGWMTFNHSNTGSYCLTP